MTHHARIRSFACHLACQTRLARQARFARLVAAAVLSLSLARIAMGADQAGDERADPVLPAGEAAAAVAPAQAPTALVQEAPADAPAVAGARPDVLLVRASRTSDAEEGPAVPAMPLRMAPSPAPAEGDLREAFAQAVQERNLIRQERDVLQSQKWFVVLYALLISAFAAWLGRHLLRRSPLAPVTASHAVGHATTRTLYAAVDARAAAHARAVANDRTHDRNGPRRNATITIRNSQTQEAEVTAQVATRRLFKRQAPGATAPALMSAALVEQLGGVDGPLTTDDLAGGDYPPTPSLAAHQPAHQPVTTARSRNARVATAALPAATPVPQSAPLRAPALPIATPVLTPPGTPIIAAALPAAAAEATADRQAVTGSGIFSPRWIAAQRTSRGFSLLEITISVAVLATVLMAVGSSILTLSSSQRIMREDARVHEIMHLFAERVMGGSWEWLGRDRSDDTVYRGAWSWPREQPRDAKDAKKSVATNPPLREDATNPLNNLSHLLIDQRKSGVDNLSLYLEYYQADALTTSFTPASGQSATGSWKELRQAQRMVPPIDLRGYNDAVVLRIAATWDSSGGGQRSHELVFARRR